MTSRIHGQSQSGWNGEQIPSQTGRTIVITGGDGAPRTFTEGDWPPPGNYSGLGYQDALALAGKGATVIITSPNEDRGREAVAAIQSQHPKADVRFEHLDLADLASVKAFSDKLRSQMDRIDVLINNAGTAGTVQRQVNGAGLERCFATNVVGHYALTAQVLPLLKRGSAPRIVFLSSSAGDGATIRFDDLQTEHDYTFLKAYSQTKIAVRIIAFELQRRSEAGRWGIQSMPVHPGVALTFLIPDGPGRDSDWGKILSSRPAMFKPAAQGALSTLYAATSAYAKGGTYYGPVDSQGNPGVASTAAYAQDRQVGSQLVEVLSKLSRLSLA